MRISFQLPPHLVLDRLTECGVEHGTITLRRCPAIVRNCLYGSLAKKASDHRLMGAVRVQG
jgi:hypothetical protein